MRSTTVRAAAFAAVSLLSRTPLVHAQAQPARPPAPPVPVSEPTIVPPEPVRDEVVIDEARSWLPDTTSREDVQAYGWELLAPWDVHPGNARLERHAVYTFNARYADEWRVGRVFLAGDAAHLMPPFAGQGLVSGLRDAANLAWKLAWVVRGQAGEQVLDSYDTERRPHARKIIRLALLLGALVMPQNRVAAFAVHGLMSLLRLLPAGRALFEDLKIKPQNTFDEGLFWRVRGSERLRGGAVLPQGWVRPATGGGPILSDDALGPQWALIGFGVDPSAGLPAELLQRWQAAGGRVWQWCQRSQALHLAPPAHRLEALDEALLPRRVPLGWVAIVRPDRCVLAEGPASEGEALLRRALELVAPPASALAATWSTPAYPIKEIRHAA